MLPEPEHRCCWKLTTSHVGDGTEAAWPATLAARLAHWGVQQVPRVRVTHAVLQKCSLNKRAGLKSLLSPALPIGAQETVAPHFTSMRTALRVTCPRAACSLVLAQWVPQADGDLIHLGPVGVDTLKKTGHVST